jgi:hypothetical protein
MDISFDNRTQNITNAIIENISSSNRTLYITISYDECVDCNRIEQTLRLVADNNTRITDEKGRPIPATQLREGMTINTTVSSAMTRSIPPQATAIRIQIVARPLPDDTTIGRIADINRQNRSFTTISGTNIASVIRFIVPANTPIFDRFGRPIDFSRLIPGMQVWVRHASFMTASIPPQTTAFEIRVR